MKQMVFAVWDVAAGAFARPFFVPARGLAVRTLTDEVNKAAPDNPLFEHPQDFRLFEFGSFDDVEGVFDLHGKPVLVVDCFSLKRSV